MDHVKKGTSLRGSNIDRVILASDGHLSEHIGATLPFVARKSFVPVWTMMCL